MTDQTDQPEAPAGDGRERDDAGKFRKGNRCGRGNPLARRAQALRIAALRAIDADELRELLRSLYAQALAGDTAAASLILARTLGQVRPASGDDDAAPLPVNLAGDPVAAAQAIAEARSAGLLTDAGAAAALAIVEARSRISQTAELLMRIEALERSARLRGRGVGWSE